LRAGLAERGIVVVWYESPATPSALS